MRMEWRAVVEENCRVIANVSLDYFECQVWMRDCPQLRGYPCIVVNKAGRITSVSYEAFCYGITTQTKLIDAKRMCRNLQIFETPTIRGKSDTSKLRHGSWEVIDIVKEFCVNAGTGVIMEYTEMDEFYLDLTQDVNHRIMYKSPSEIDGIHYPVLMDGNVYLEGRGQTISNESLEYRVKGLYPKSYVKSHNLRDEERLMHGSMFVEELLSSLFNHTGFRASAGVGSNKLMAKLACSLNKPSSITVLPHTALPRVSYMIDIRCIPGLCGQRGEQLKTSLGIETMGELCEIPLDTLESFLQPEIAFKVFMWSHGWSDVPVVPKYMVDEISCGKTFPNYVGATGIRNESDLRYFIQNLSDEMVERLKEEKCRNYRTVDYLKIQCVYWNKRNTSSSVISSTFPIDFFSDTGEKIAWKACKEIVQKPFHFPTMKIKSLTLFAKNFRTLSSPPISCEGKQLDGTLDLNNNDLNMANKNYISDKLKEHDLKKCCQPIHPQSQDEDLQEYSSSPIISDS